MFETSHIRKCFGQFVELKKSDDNYNYSLNAKCLRFLIFMRSILHYALKNCNRIVTNCNERDQMHGTTFNNQPLNHLFEVPDYSNVQPAVILNKYRNRKTSRRFPCFLPAYFIFFSLVITYKNPIEELLEKYFSLSSSLPFPAFSSQSLMLYHHHHHHSGQHHQLKSLSVYVCVYMQ